MNTNTTVNVTMYDGYLGLYAGSFNPTSPLTNALQYDDDTGAANLTNSRITRVLNAGQYVLVQTGATNSQFGLFTGSISGPGAAVIVPGVAPEPAAWGLMLLGFGAAGGALRLRKRTARIALAS